MLNVYYFFSATQRPYLPTELEMTRAQKRCLRLIFSDQHGALPGTPGNIVIAVEVCSG